MILTVTLNPAVDVSYKLDEFLIDTVNRVEDVSKTAGGKGLNVARVLHLLGEDAAATGFLGGSLGDFISSEINSLGIHDFFVNIAGETRNCIAVIHEGKQTEILESGPTISESEAALFLEKFANDVHKFKMVTISGSLPKGLPTDFYIKLMEIARQHDTSVLLDTSGSILTTTVTNDVKPYFIKPNREEFAGLLGEKSVSEPQIIEALTTPQFASIPWIVVTLGADGAIVKHERALYRATIAKIEAVNPVGSGDAVVAGFAAGMARGFADDELIAFGLAMGVLNALEKKTGHINPEQIEWAIQQIYVEKI